MFVAVLGAGLSLFAVFWVFQPLAPQVYRPAFLAVALLLTFIVFGHRKDPQPVDWIVALVGRDRGRLRGDHARPRAPRRAARRRSTSSPASPRSCSSWRPRARTTGIALPIICGVFLLYAFFGGLIPDWLEIGHKGYGIDRIVGQSYMGLEGIFGVPLDVAATYIVLFAIYGAVLEFSGAARFFVEISFAAFGRSRTGPGRTSALAGFLLGTVSGSGVATTVTLGSVAWPLLRKAGYPKDEGGGIMAASGIGAILSPPTLGAAAFIIAEILEVSYLQVLVYALVPSILYYVGILMAIEADARRHDVKGIDMEVPGAGKLLVRWGYHFSSLVLIVFLLAIRLQRLPRGDHRHRHRVPAELPGPPRLDGPEGDLGGARRRRPRRAADRRHHRGRRDHRRRRLADRPRPEARGPDRRPRGRQPARSPRSSRRSPC